jgi:hypothetical protein
MRRAYLDGQPDRVRPRDAQRTRSFVESRRLINTEIARCERSLPAGKGAQPSCFEKVAAVADAPRASSRSIDDKRKSSQDAEGAPRWPSTSSRRRSSAVSFIRLDDLEAIAAI